MLPKDTDGKKGSADPWFAMFAQALDLFKSLEYNDFSFTVLCFSKILQKEKKKG